MAAVGPGWYPDAQDAQLERWWDGSTWTAHTRPRGAHHAAPGPAFTPATRSSTPSGVEVKPSAAKDGIVSKAWSHAIMTSVGILVTALVTGLIGQQKQQEIKREGGRGAVKSQEIISDLLTTQKQTLAELAACRAGTAPPKPTIAGGTEPGTAATPPPEPVAAVTLDGDWFTPDGTVVWKIQGNHANIHSTGQLAGFVNGTAELALQGTSLSGTMQAATYYGMMSGSANFTGQVQGDFINGTIQDQSGTAPLVLMRSR